MTASATTITTKTVPAPGAELTYDIRPAEGSAAPTLLLIGSPMGAGGFATLASYFPDRTIVTYDPRGVERSIKDDPSVPSNPDQHADDVHRVIGAIGDGPVDLFASSGGAVNALALVAKHPEDVRMLVAHEPPLAAVLPDREAALAVSRAVHDAYLRSGFGVGMARFIATVSHSGPFTADDAAQPDPDPAMFGLPPDDDGARTDPLLAQNMIGTTHYEPDIDALRRSASRIVLAVGEESEGTLASRAAYSLAERLGTAPVTFPSGHGGFLGNEYGQPGKPEAFAAKLREVLDGAG
jgi:pimeloyl-ACP methyl ester carboxylesterase